MSARYHAMTELLELFPNNPVILEAVIKTEDHINTVARNGGKIMVSISGGSDSDIMLDMFEKLGYDEGEVIYVWFDTGLEYDATKRHLKCLEQKYGIEIKRYRPEMTVAQACKKYGVPFLSKDSAQRIFELQKKGFDFKVREFEGDVQRFPNVLSGLKWFYCRKKKYNVSAFSGLREFMSENAPPAISHLCCKAAKKDVAKKAIKDLSPVLDVTGIRVAEGGVRATAFTSCFSEATDKRIARFRPIFYFSDADKQEYKEFCGVTYSDCYEVWGFKRTGCACCPFGSKFEDELEVVKQYEPKLYSAACKIFGPSYEYTRKYRAFKESYKREKRRGGQIDLFDDPYERMKEGAKDG